MTEQEQRIAIAKWCGWVVEPSMASGGWNVFNKHQRKPDVTSFWFNSDKTPTLFDCLLHLPDYLHDLNAMREAWSHLDEEAKIRFIHELYTVCGFDICVFGHDDTRQASEVSNATAAQRAEALLRTIGKWVDSPAKSACQPGISETVGKA